MKKRRFLFFAMNLAAAVGVGFSAYINWWNNSAPKDTSLAQVLPFQLPDQISAMYPSVAAVVLASAGFLLVASLFSLRSLAIAGLSAIAFIAVSWFLNIGTDLQSTSFNDGFYIAAASVAVSFASLFLRRHQHEGKKK